MAPSVGRQELFLMACRPGLRHSSPRPDRNDYLFCSLFNASLRALFCGSRAKAALYCSPANSGLWFGEGEAKTIVTGYGMGVGACVLLIWLAKLRLPSYAAMLTYSGFVMVAIIAAISKDKDLPGPIHLPPDPQQTGRVSAPVHAPPRLPDCWEHSP